MTDVSDASEMQSRSRSTSVPPKENKRKVNIEQMKQENISKDGTSVIVRTDHETVVIRNEIFELAMKMGSNSVFRKPYPPGSDCYINKTPAPLKKQVPPPAPAPTPTPVLAPVAVPAWALPPPPPQINWADALQHLPRAGPPGADPQQLHGTLLELLYGNSNQRPAQVQPVNPIYHQLPHGLLQHFPMQRDYVPVVMPTPQQVVGNNGSRKRSYPTTAPADVTGPQQPKAANPEVRRDQEGVPNAAGGTTPNEEAMDCS